MMLRKISVIAQSNGTDALFSPNVGEASRTSPSVCSASLRKLPPTPQLCALRAQRRAQIQFDLVGIGRSRRDYGVTPVAHEHMTHDHGCRRRGCSRRGWRGPRRRPERRTRRRRGLATGGARRRSRSAGRAAGAGPGRAGGAGRRMACLIDCILQFPAQAKLLHFA